MISYYDLISENDESTVVSYFEKSYTAGERAYMSEKRLEDQFVLQLEQQQYEYVALTSEEELIKNLRRQIEKLNKVSFNDGEWKRFFTTNIAKPNAGIVEKTRTIQEDPRFTFTFDDGKMQNIMLLDKTHIHENHLQVMRQYKAPLLSPQGGRIEGGNRYDVTILVNGLPLVHVELKRPGVDIREAFNQIKRYNRDSFWADKGLFEYVQIYVISNGTYTKYYSNTTRDRHLKEEDERQKKGQVVSNSFEFTSWWTDAHNKKIAMLEDFTSTFFAKHTILNILTRFCVFTVDKHLMVMRPYQIAATERILNRIKMAYNQKKYGSIDAGGYVWHTTGSGKTLTSFKTSQLASKLPYIDKVLFVVDRKDLDYQTMREYDNFQKDAANSNTSVAVLERQLNDPTCKIIITTIQKLSILVSRKMDLNVYNQHVVMIFDECHRSQFGEMHTAIIKKFKKYYIFGFTGTPIFADNANTSGKANLRTTNQVFGDKLHTYTIINAINDKNVLPFRVEYIRTMREKDGVEDMPVTDIDREKIMRDPKYISNIVTYIIRHFGQKTKRNSTYQVKDQRKQGFNSIFATASIDFAKLYYREFKRQMQYLPEEKRLKVAMIYSYGANDEDPLDGELFDENPEDPSTLSQTDKDALQECIDDYNKEFGQNFDLSSKGFQNFYKDMSERVKNRELDLLIVVNMFLTGFDAKTLNTLWVDKNLKMHGLIQAYSRTNRILNSVKTFGNIVCFRNLEQATNDAIGLFGNEEAKGLVLLKTFEDYYCGYTDTEGSYKPGYKETVERLLEQYPLDREIIGEEAKREFVKTYSYVMSLFNILSTFDAFEDKQILSEQDRQHYASVYIELYHEFKGHRGGDAENVNDDIVFEMELIKQDEISIDRILAIIQEYAKNHMNDLTVVPSISKAIDASPDLRNKKELIEKFIAGMTPDSNVGESWAEYVKQKKNEELQRIIEEERLKPEETQHFMETAFRNGFISMSGTAFSQILPPMSRFAKDGAREKKRNDVFEKLSAFLEKYKNLITEEDDEELIDFAPEPPTAEKPETVPTDKEHKLKGEKERAVSVDSAKDAEGKEESDTQEGVMKALAIRQPWATLIVKGIKDVECRDKMVPPCKRFLVAASATKEKWSDLDSYTKKIIKEYQAKGVLPPYNEWPTKAILGYVDIESYQYGPTKSVWGRDNYGINYLLTNAHEFKEPITGKNKATPLFYNVEGLDLANIQD
ncbi:MAG: HsdR family type I site-specific deoxyribonuclease [Bacteroidaceae bacterium]|nr:HsdR family type I site-specific deoxyribonuclease [Bacteroidaceae bacterium]